MLMDYEKEEIKGQRTQWKKCKDKNAAQEGSSSVN